MSVELPSNPPEGWWIRIRLMGSDSRLTGDHPDSSSEHIYIATP
jgi:hypothetical protein